MQDGCPPRRRRRPGPAGLLGGEVGRGAAPQGGPVSAAQLCSWRRCTRATGLASPRSSSAAKRRAPTHPACCAAAGWQGGWPAHGPERERPEERPACGRAGPTQPSMHSLRTWMSASSTCSPRTTFAKSLSLCGEMARPRATARLVVPASPSTVGVSVRGRRLSEAGMAWCPAGTGCAWPSGHAAAQRRAGRSNLCRKVRQAGSAAGGCYSARGLAAPAMLPRRGRTRRGCAPRSPALKRAALPRTQGEHAKGRAR